MVMEGWMTSRWFSHLQKGVPPHPLGADSRGIFPSGFTRIGPREYTVTGSRADIQNPQGFSDENGQYTTVVYQHRTWCVSLTV